MPGFLGNIETYPGLAEQQASWDAYFDGVGESIRRREREAHITHVLLTDENIGQRLVEEGVVREGCYLWQPFYQIELGQAAGKVVVVMDDAPMPAWESCAADVIRIPSR